MKNKVDKSANVVIYQDKEGDIKLDVFLENETVWLNQSQMAQLFGKGRTTITEHINNIFREGELSEKVVSRYFRRTTLHGAIKGKTQTMATQNTPMYMSDWIDQLDSILRMNKRELLTHAGKISRKQMEQKAGAEYQKFKIRLKEQEKLDSLKELEADLKSLEEGREAV